MKFIYCILSIICLTNCKFNDQSGKVTSENDTMMIENRERQLNNADKDIDYIYAYEDSVIIFATPSENSIQIRTLKELEKIKMSELFISFNGDTTNSLYESNWISVGENSDRGWIRTSDMISFNSILDTVEDLIFHHRFHLMEIFGVGYKESKIWDLSSHEIILQETLNKDKSRKINDSLYIFSINDNYIKLYDYRNDTMIFGDVGALPEINSKTNQIFYIQWQQDSLINSRNAQWNLIPCELLVYNYKTGDKKLLYKEIDIKRKPYHWGPDFRYPTNIVVNQTNNSLFIEFFLYEMNKNPQDEGDFEKILVRVDTSGFIFNN